MTQNQLCAFSGQPRHRFDSSFSLPLYGDDHLVFTAWFQVVVSYKEVVKAVRGSQLRQGSCFPLLGLKLHPCNSHGKSACFKFRWNFAFQSVRVGAFLHRGTNELLSVNAYSVLELNKARYGRIDNT